MTTDSYEPCESDLAAANDKVALKRLTVEILKQHTGSVPITTKEAAEQAKKLLAQGIRSLW